MVRQILILLTSMTSALLLFLGCASTHYSRGHKALAQAQYEQALTELRSAIVEDYRNTDAIRDIGIALHHKGKSAIAQKFIRLSLSRNPRDFLSQYYLGLTWEALGQYQKAIESYRHYTEISPFNKLRRVVEDRMLVLLQKQARHLASLLHHSPLFVAAPDIAAARTLTLATHLYFLLNATFLL